MENYTVVIPKDGATALVDVYNNLITDGRYVRCRVDAPEQFDIKDLLSNPCLSDGNIAVIGNNHIGLVLKNAMTYDTMVIIKDKYRTKLTFYGNPATIGFLKEVPRHKLVQYLLDRKWISGTIIRRVQVDNDANYSVNKM